MYCDLFKDMKNTWVILHVIQNIQGGLVTAKDILPASFVSCQQHRCLIYLTRATVQSRKEGSLREKMKKEKDQKDKQRDKRNKPESSL